MDAELEAQARQTEVAEIEALMRKSERNELRAKDAEFRLRYVRAEIALIKDRKELEALRETLS